MTPSDTRAEWRGPLEEASRSDPKIIETLPATQLLVYLLQNASALPLAVKATCWYGQE